MAIYGLESARFGSETAIIWRYGIERYFLNVKLGFFR